MSFFLKPGPRYSWKKVFLLITLSLLPLLSVFVFFLSHHSKPTASSLKIKVIAQTGQALPTLFFAEILQLCVDHPTAFDDFDENVAVEKLLATHIIKSVEVRKIKPETLWIDYTLQKPIALVGEFSNTALSEEGVVHPMAPFYSAKKLPVIYLGDQFKEPWGSKVGIEVLEYLRQIRNILHEEEVTCIDLSKASAASAGKREIVVCLKERTLRLTPKNYLNELADYSILKKKLLQKEKEPLVLDFRIPNVAYMNLSH